MKDPFKKEREATDWEKISNTSPSNIGLGSKMYKEFSKLNSTETTQLENGQKI